MRMSTWSIGEFVHARGLAMEWKYPLNHIFKIQDIIKPGSTLGNFMNFNVLRFKNFN
jgi:hypothetical protein